MTRFISIFLLIVLLNMACSKSSDAVTARDTEAPVVKILGPTSLQHFKTGDPLCITATLFDLGVISRASVKIVKDGQAAPLLQYDYVVNEMTLTLEKKIIVPDTMVGNCTLVVEATDNFGNKGQAISGFSAN